MKKYVKPLMQSEAFVTNEYVSACFVYECNCGSLDYATPLRGFDNVGKAAESQGMMPGEEKENPSYYVFDGDLFDSTSCPNVQDDDHVGRSPSHFFWWFVDLLFGTNFYDPGNNSTIDSTHHHVYFKDVSTIQGYGHPNAS